MVLKVLTDCLGLNCLGFLYHNGFGVPRDYKKALSHYEQAAILENVKGFIFL